MALIPLLPRPDSQVPGLIRQRQSRGWGYWAGCRGCLESPLQGCWGPHGGPSTGDAHLPIPEGAGLLSLRTLGRLYSPGRLGSPPGQPSSPPEDAQVPSTAGPCVPPPRNDPPPVPGLGLPDLPLPLGGPNPGVPWVGPSFSVPSGAPRLHLPGGCPFWGRVFWGGFFFFSPPPFP